MLSAGLGPGPGAPPSLPIPSSSSSSSSSSRISTTQPKPHKLEREMSIAMYVMYMVGRPESRQKICATPRPFRALHLILFLHFFFTLSYRLLTELTCTYRWCIILASIPESCTTFSQDRNFGSSFDSFEGRRDVRLSLAPAYSTSTVLSFLSSHQVLAGRLE
jgi:hypothetical protein